MVPGGAAAAAFILLRNWVIGRWGEGHAVAVFCVEGPARGRRAARQRLWGRYRPIEFSKSGQPNRSSRFAGGSTKEDGNS